MKKHNLTGSKEIGKFCEHFGYDKVYFPSESKRPKERDIINQKITQKNKNGRG